VKISTAITLVHKAVFNTCGYMAINVLPATDENYCPCSVYFSTDSNECSGAFGQVADFVSGYIGLVTSEAPNVILRWMKKHRIMALRIDRIGATIHSYISIRGRWIMTRAAIVNEDYFCDFDTLFTNELYLTPTVLAGRQ